MSLDFSCKLTQVYTAQPHRLEFCDNMYSFHYTGVTQYIQELVDKLCRYSPGYSVLWRFCLMSEIRAQIETEELKECLRRVMSSK